MFQISFCALLCIFNVNLAFECPGAGNYSDPTSCNAYFRCEDGRATNQVCLSSELFNSDTGKCDHLDKVTCTGRRRHAIKSANYKIVCYFPSWAGYREKGGKFVPSQIHASLCTHVNYAFASLDNTSLTIKMGDPEADKQFYKQTIRLKKKNPNLKVMLSLGGWTDSTDKYSKLVSRKAARKRFNRNVIYFLSKYGFDGLDVDWEYPACSHGKCANKTSDQKNFALWIKELRVLFDKQNPKLLLSAAVSPVAYFIDKAYDVPTIAKAFDYINVMGYDYSSSGNNVTGQNAPFRASSGMNPKLTVEYAMKYWEQLGAPANKLVLGLPSYGVSFTLNSSKDHGFGAPARGPGEPGPYTKNKGHLAYYEICQNVKDGWSKGGDNKAGVFAFKNDQWVGYDDPDAVARKAQFVKNRRYAGVMVWDISMDDFNGNCCGVKYPLMRVASKILNGNGKSLSSVKCQ